MGNIEKRIKKGNLAAILWIVIVVIIVIVWFIQALFLGGAGELKLAWTIITFTAIVIANVHLVGNRILKTLIEIRDGGHHGETVD